MHSFLSRANTIFAFTLSVMAGLTFLCFLSTTFIEYKAPVTIRATKVIVKNLPDFSTSKEKNDLGHVTFDLISDLEPLFNWNVKQLFLYLTAEYKTETNRVNQVVLWDRIIKRGENAQLNYQQIHSKYYFWDNGSGLRGNKNVTLTLSWNIIPNAGTLPKIAGQGSHRFAFPDEYTTSKV